MHRRLVLALLSTIAAAGLLAPTPAQAAPATPRTTCTTTGKVKTCRVAPVVEKRTTTRNSYGQKVTTTVVRSRVITTTATEVTTTTTWTTTRAVGTKKASTSRRSTTRKPLTKAPVTTPVTPKPTNPTPPPAPEPDLTPEQFAAEIFRLTNVERAKAGLPQFEPDPCLQRIATAWSVELARTRTFTHGDAHTRLRTCYRMSTYGENIAMGYGTPQAFVTAWMNSPGHRANILNPRYSYLGVGLDAGSRYATQDFSSPEY